ncbi:NAD-dependent epimerase/dehydratase family protein [Solihabitans fulvus]|uniref:NAD-dependent epimerase/dehydratase family protein n=1 Tax=Solihabitans fulvus TaxID=1892852 RepID=UPI001661CD5C|nr:NAD-dependent epimerase/dehydratase family protein [Solihabitans fulvus]
MTDRPLIGVLGAAGAVGGALVETLAARGLGRLRLGTRRPGPARQLGAGVELASVDLARPESLRRFCDGCAVVANCVGPVAGPPAEVAEAVLRAGAGYVDAGGDEPLRARLAALPGTAVIGAGVRPGLSGLLPRWLARTADPSRDTALVLTGYLATTDRMTRGAAAEFLLDLAEGDGEPGALWRSGARVPRALEPEHGTLPFFAGAIIAYPYLSAEIERVARSIPLAEVRWYQVFEAGGRMLATLSRLQEALRQGARPADLAGELTRAVDAEMFGRKSAQQLVFELAGPAGGQVAVLHASSTYRLTATVTALAVAALLAGTLPVGAYFAAEALDSEAVAGLPGQPGVAGLNLLDGSLADYRRVEEGAL